MQNTDTSRAKAIIVEIIREAGGTLHNKSHLFKAFWIAHVAFAEKRQRDLSEWPVVKMPNGPGIHDFDRLLGELMQDGLVETEEIAYGGGHTGFVFHLLADAPTVLNDDEKCAVRAGYNYVKDKSAAELSDDSHEKSRAWRAARMGQQMDLLLDAMDEETFERLRQRAESYKPLMDAVVAAGRN